VISKVHSSLGLLINFNVDKLKEGIRRVIIIRDHRGDIMRNCININKINKLLCVLCGYYLHYQF